MQTTYKFYLLPAPLYRANHLNRAPLTIYLLSPEYKFHVITFPVVLGFCHGIISVLSSRYFSQVVIILVS